MFEQEYARVEKPFETVPEKIEPYAEHIAAPRDHTEDKRPSKLGWFGTIMLILVGIAIVVGVLVFGAFFLHQRQERSRKRCVLFLIEPFPFLNLYIPLGFTKAHTCHMRYNINWQLASVTFGYIFEEDDLLFSPLPLTNLYYYLKTSQA
jgi:hypothetical protein